MERKGKRCRVLMELIWQLEGKMENGYVKKDKFDTLLLPLGLLRSRARQNFRTLLRYFDICASLLASWGVPSPCQKEFSEGKRKVSLI